MSNMDVAVSFFHKHAINFTEVLWTSIIMHSGIPGRGSQTTQNTLHSAQYLCFICVSRFTLITEGHWSSLLCWWCVCLLCEKTRLTARAVPRKNSLRLTRVVDWDGGLRAGMMGGKERREAVLYFKRAVRLSLTGLIKWQDALWKQEHYLPLKRPGKAL